MTKDEIQQVLKERQTVVAPFCVYFQSLKEGQRRSLISAENGDWVFRESNLNRAATQHMNSQEKLRSCESTNHHTTKEEIQVTSEVKIRPSDLLFLTFHQEKQSPSGATIRFVYQ